MFDMRVKPKRVSAFAFKKGFANIHTFFIYAVYDERKKPKEAIDVDNYENEQPREPVQEDPATAQEQPEYQPNPDQQRYHGAGTGRKESPFADSPYVMNREAPKAEPYTAQNAYVPPVPPEKPPRKPKNGHGSGKVWMRVLCAVLALAVLAGSCGLTAYFVNARWENETGAMIESFEQRFNDLQAQIAGATANQNQIVGYPEVSYVTAPGAIYQNNVASVVLITARVTSSIYGQTTTGTSSGSGFVITEDGYVVTNHHVIENATSVKVTLHDGTEYDAKVIGSDSTNDVAVLKITEEVKLKAVTIGSSTALSVGDQVVAIGNPLGELTSTLTVGYVSAKERNVTTEGTTINMIQTDAAINSGNSGGPLFNAQGEVVGITTAKYSGSSSSGATIEGIGFAIPIDDVMPLVDDLMNYGYINTAYLGVMVSVMDADTASRYGLPVGAYVEEVTSGYSAHRAGVKAKDIIVALGDYEVENVSDLTKALRKFRAGDTTTITVYRGGQKLVLPITLDEKPRDTDTEVPADYGSSQMPAEGDYDEWFDYFAPFFGGGKG